MMFKVKKIQIRTDLTIPFFHECKTVSDEYRNYFKKNYVKTGKWIESINTLSSNNLMHTSVTTWKSHDDFLEFANDDFINEHSIHPNREYNLKNNIEMFFESEEE